jgi:hypothetical protein
MGTLPGQTGGVYHFWGITHSTCPTGIAQCPMLGSDRYPPPDMQRAWVLDYYRQRADEEQAAAERAVDPAIAQIHRDMAQRIATC